MDVRALSHEEKEEIEHLAIDAVALLNTHVEGSMSLINKLKEFVSGVKDNSFDVGDVKEVAFKLGSLYGQLIREAYGWKWIHATRDDASAYCVASPDEYFCCQVHVYLYRLLTTSKTNNVKLLFNMMADLQVRNDQKEKYVFLN